MNIGQGIMIMAINIFTAVLKALLVHVVISASWSPREELSLGPFTEAETKREEHLPLMEHSLGPGFVLCLLQHHLTDSSAIG